MGEIMAGQATPAQLAGFVLLLRAKGETAGGAGRAGAHHARGRRAGGPCPARRSTWWAPAATGPTRSTSRRWPRWWSPAPGARVVKHGNRAASSACGAADLLEALGVAAGPGRAGGGAVRRGGRHRLLLRAGLPPGLPARRRAAAGDRRADRVQLPRPADQPGPAGRGRGRLRGRADGAGDGGGARRARRHRAGLPRRRRAGRADHDDHVAGLGGPRRRGAGGPARPGRARAAAGGPGRPARRGRRVQRRRGAGAAGRGARARCGTRCCSTRRPRWPRTTGWPDRCRRRWRPGWPGRRRRSTAARPPTCWTAGSPVSRDAAKTP